MLRGVIKSMQTAAQSKTLRNLSWSVGERRARREKAWQEENCQVRSDDRKCVSRMPAEKAIRLPEKWTTLDSIPCAEHRENTIFQGGEVKAEVKRRILAVLAGLTESNALNWISEGESLAMLNLIGREK